MPKIITPDELPLWVPGELLVSSTELGWKDVVQRSYRYQGQEVSIPPLDHFMIVRYHKGFTPMYRSVDETQGLQTTCIPDDISLLTNSQPSYWNWTKNIEVSHTYLSNSLMSRIAGEVIERSICDVQLHDKLQVKDPIMIHIIDTINAEVKNHGLGGSIYVEALSIQLAIHLLRNYASVEIKLPSSIGFFDYNQEKLIKDYVKSHIHENIKLEDLAKELGTGEWTFSRRFRETFSCTPYTYITEQRLIMAKDYLVKTNMAIKEIAYECGFSDQAHLTRMIRTKYGATPRQIRNNT